MQSIDFRWCCEVNEKAQGPELGSGAIVKDSSAKKSKKPMESSVRNPVCPAKMVELNFAVSLSREGRLGGSVRE